MENKSPVCLGDWHCKNHNTEYWPKQTNKFPVSKKLLEHSINGNFHTRLKSQYNALKHFWITEERFSWNWHNFTCCSVPLIIWKLTTRTWMYANSPGIRCWINQMTSSPWPWKTSLPHQTNRFLRTSCRWEYFHTILFFSKRVMCWQRKYFK